VAAATRGIAVKSLCDWIVYLSSILPIRPVPLSASQIRCLVLSTEMFRTTDPAVGILIVSILAVFLSKTTMLPFPASS
jgi:hypothetical protein